MLSVDKRQEHRNAYLGDAAYMSPEYRAGYLAGLIAASNAAAVEHDSLGWEGAVRAIEKRIEQERGSASNGD